MSFIKEYLGNMKDKFILTDKTDGVLQGSVIPSNRYFPEEERSKQPSLFSVVRSLKELFSSDDAGQLGLYGSLGYDLTFQFEPVEIVNKRDSEQRDLVMYLPDEILVVDNQKKGAWKIKYDFSSSADLKRTTAGLPRTAAESRYEPAPAGVRFSTRDGPKGKYAESVTRAKEEFRVGNLFEVVLSQAFREVLQCKPSKVFRR
jgi:anthranilate synthase